MSSGTPAILDRLSAAYPRQVLEPATVALYISDLGGIPDRVLSRAADRMIRTSEWFPTIRAIREACAEDVLALPTPTEALQLVEEVLRQERSTQSVAELVRQSVVLVGGYREFRHGPEPRVLRGQFLKHYRELRASAIQNAVLAPALVPAPGPREIAA